MRKVTFLVELQELQRLQGLRGTPGLRGVPGVRYFPLDEVAAASSSVDLV